MRLNHYDYQECTTFLKSGTKYKLKLLITMGWNDITIKQYALLSKAMTDKYESEELKVLSIVSVLFNKSIEELQNIPISELSKLINESKFIYEPNDSRLPTIIKIGGKKLLVEHSITNITSGQYIDLSTYCKSVESINNNYHNIVALFLQPIDLFGRGVFSRAYERAKTKDEQIIVSEKIVKERAQIAELLLTDLTMDKVFAISNYFFLLSKNLTKATEVYLEKQKTKATKKLNHFLTKNDMPSIGDGL